MALVAVCYCSGAGHTRVLAEEVAAGAAAGCEVRLVDVEVAVDWDLLHRADGILFGAPTYMGSVAAGFKTFMDATSDFWSDQLWQDKMAGGFTVGSSPSGDKTVTLATLAVFAAQHGMIWVGQAEIGPPNKPERAGVNLDGFSHGLAATSSRDKSVMIEPGDRATARMFGARFAGAVARWVRE